MDYQKEISDKLMCPSQMTKEQKLEVIQDLPDIMALEEEARVSAFEHDYANTMFLVDSTLSEETRNYLLSQDIAE